MNRKEHQQLHRELHQHLDMLVADWIAETKSLPSKATVLELLQWSYKQSIEATDVMPDDNDFDRNSDILLGEMRDCGDK